MMSRKPFSSTRAFCGLVERFGGDFPSRFNEKIVERLLVGALNEHEDAARSLFPGPDGRGSLRWTSGTSHLLGGRRPDVLALDERGEVAVVIEVKVSAAWSFPTKVTRDVASGVAAVYGASQLDHYHAGSPAARHYVVLRSSQARRYPSWRCKHPADRDPDTETTATSSSTRHTDGFRYPGREGAREQTSADHWTLVPYPTVTAALRAAASPAMLHDASTDPFVHFLSDLGCPD